jgi:SNF2 family DNA or RNA helicase
MTFTLLPHQEDGVDFMINREPHENSKTKLFGSILADEMGLGKTIQTIGLIKRSPLKSTIIFCPSTLIHMWREQLERFAPEIDVFIFREKNTLDEFIQKKQDEKYIIITSYGISFRRPELLSFDFDRIVCDEAHMFRNAKSKIFRGLFKIRGKTKLLLTGTPIQNKLADLATLINFIIGREMVMNVDFIKLFLKERMIRRKIADVGIEMPKLTINHVELDSSTSNEEALELTKNFDYNHQFEKIIRRRQASTFPTALLKSFYTNYEMEPLETDNEKTDMIISNVIKEKRNCIIFTEFKDELKYTKEQIQSKLPQFKIESISGETPLEERQRIASDKELNVLIIQINTAGVGLNLQHFNVAHFTNTQWNPSTLDQAIGRINRIGQESEMEVFIYTFVDSIDERIKYIALKKRELIESIIEN